MYINIYFPDDTDIQWIAKTVRQHFTPPVLVYGREGIFTIVRSIGYSMNEVLIAIDDDEDRALAHATAVLDLFDGNIQAHLLHVFQENLEGASITNFATARAVKEHLEDAGIDVTLHERSGDPAAEIVDAADEMDVDLITIAGRKRSPTGKLLFGSVAQDVILSTPRSVLVCDTVSEQ